MAAAPESEGPVIARAPPAPGVAVLRAMPAQATMDICGVGRVPLTLPQPESSASPEMTLPHLFRHARAAAWAPVLAALDVGQSERGRAAASVLRASGVDDEMTDDREVSTHARRLAAMAAQSTDTAVLQWAWALCQRVRSVPECLALTPQAVVRSDPDDGRLWLLLATHDPSEIDRAVRQAAQALRHGPLPSLLPSVEPLLPPGLPAYLQAEMLMQTLSAELEMSDNGVFAALQHCRSRPAARQVCLALAETLVARSSDLLGMALGRALGQRLGWPAARLAELKREQEALDSALLTPALELIYTCDSVEQRSAWMRDRAVHGERASLQRRRSSLLLSAPSSPGAASR